MDYACFIHRIPLFYHLWYGHIHREFLHLFSEILPTEFIPTLRHIPSPVFSSFNLKNPRAILKYFRKVVFISSSNGEAVAESETKLTTKKSNESVNLFEGNELVVKKIYIHIKDLSAALRYTEQLQEFLLSNRDEKSFKKVNVLKFHSIVKIKLC